MNDARGGIVDDLDTIFLGSFLGESRPISSLLLLAHHCWSVMVVVQITPHIGCVTLGTKTIRQKEMGKVT